MIQSINVAVSDILFKRFASNSEIPPRRRRVAVSWSVTVSVKKSRGLEWRRRKGTKGGLKLISIFFRKEGRLRAWGSHTWSLIIIFLQCIQRCQMQLAFARLSDSEKHMFSWHAIVVVTTCLQRRTQASIIFIIVHTGHSPSIVCSIANYSMYNHNHNHQNQISNIINYQCHYFCYDIFTRWLAPLQHVLLVLGVSMTW